MADDHSEDDDAVSVGSGGPGVASTSDKLPIRMLHDRILVEPDTSAGERTSTAGIVIPATAQVGKRLIWGHVVATGPHVHQVKLGDTILFDPADRAEVEFDATAYTLLRERDVHAVSEDQAEEPTGLYL